MIQPAARAPDACSLLSMAGRRRPVGAIARPMGRSLCHQKKRHLRVDHQRSRGGRPSGDGRPGAARSGEPRRPDPIEKAGRSFASSALMRTPARVARQDMTSRTSGSGPPAKVHWTGVVSGHVATFEGGYQMTLLPGGMYVGCPCDVSKSVAEMQAFHLEFCWMESPTRRQRLIRTYDAEGQPVSSTHFLETKV